MDPVKISKRVTDIIEFVGQGEIAEKIAALRSAADLLSQIVVAEATAASLIATFRNIHNKDSLI